MVRLTILSLLAIKLMASSVYADQNVPHRKALKDMTIEELSREKHEAENNYNSMRMMITLISDDSSRNGLSSSLYLIREYLNNVEGELKRKRETELFEMEKNAKTKFNERQKDLLALIHEAEGAWGNHDGINSKLLVLDYQLAPGAKLETLMSAHAKAKNQASELTSLIQEARAFLRFDSEIIEGPGQLDPEFRARVLNKYSSLAKSLRDTTGSLAKQSEIETGLMTKDSPMNPLVPPVMKHQHTPTRLPR